MTSHPFKSAAELIAFRKLHATLKDRLPTTVWVFEIGDMYVLCDPDAQHATASLPPTNLRRFDVPSTQGNDIKMISVLAAKYSQRLLQHILLVLHYRVEIYRFKGGNYAVALQGSPCDLSELKDVVFGSESDDSAPSTNGYSQKMLAMGPICSIVLEGDSKAPLVGVCSWHEASRTTKLAEFYDNTGHDMLESLLVQFGPMEAVIANQPKYRTVTKVLERNKILVTVAAPKKASLAKSEADIEKCLNNHLCESKKVAFKAFAVLHQHVHVDLTDMVAEKGAQLVNIDDFVHLNWQADSGLNLLGGPGQPMSLFKVLNKTRTSGGERLLRVWLRQPLTDRLKIEERLGIVEEFVSESGTRKTLHDSCLRRIPDLEGLSVKLEDKKATLQDMYKCYIGAKEVGKVAEHLSQMDCKLIIDTFVMPLTKKLDKLEKFIELVDTTLDMEAVASDNVFMVKASFDNDLMELAEKRNKIKADINASVAKVAGYVGLDQKSVKLELTNQHGYTFRVTMKDEKSLRKKTSDIMIVDTHKTGVRFRDRRLEQLNRSYLSVNGDFEEQQRYVVSEISEIACGYAPHFATIGHLVAHLDCLVGFAVAAVLAPVPYCRPKICDRDQGTIKLVEARHPCLEMLDNMTFIPNNMTFDKEKRFCIITGPNLGGKSTFLRTVALNVLMAQVGSFVAASEACIFPVDRVLVRVGAGDSQLQGVSTFMAEMLEAAHIIRASTRNSLILIDELGRGTSTYDGLGLAWSISEHIATHIKAPTLFATHFHEVTQLADSVPASVFNCYVDAVATADQFTLLYQVKPGSSNKSFGLEVARLAGFPQKVLEDARGFLETAEMPILRNTKEFGANQVEEFLSTYNDPKTDKKRKQEMLGDMKAKVARLATNENK